MLYNGKPRSMFNQCVGSFSKGAFYAPLPVIYTKQGNESMARCPVDLLLYRKPVFRLNDFD